MGDTTYCPVAPERGAEFNISSIEPPMQAHEVKPKKFQRFALL
jgi:hypothetical protein